MDGHISCSAPLMLKRIQWMWDGFVAAGEKEGRLKEANLSLFCCLFFSPFLFEMRDKLERNSHKPIEEVWTICCSNLLSSFIWWKSVWMMPPQWILTALGRLCWECTKTPPVQKTECKNKTLNQTKFREKLAGSVCTDNSKRRLEWWRESTTGIQSVRRQLILRSQGLVSIKELLALQPWSTWCQNLPFLTQSIL